MEISKEIEKLKSIGKKKSMKPKADSLKRSKKKKKSINLYLGFL